MPRFASFDRRRYRTLPAREGYSRWAVTYEDTIKHDMDIWLLDELQTVSWDKIERCADLGCGTDRTAAWLVSKGVRTIDSIDATPGMLERARARNVFASLNVANVSDSRLPGATYDLVITCPVMRFEESTSVGEISLDEDRRVYRGNLRWIRGT